MKVRLRVVEGRSTKKGANIANTISRFEYELAPACKKLAGIAIVSTV